MKTYFSAAALFVLTTAMIVGSGTLASGQNQPGGGNLPREAVGGAALIFRKPEDPNAQSVGGGRISGRVKTRVAAAAQDKIIAKGNAARSAPKPRFSEAEEQYKLAANQDPTDARAHAGLGNVYLDQGRYSDAAGAYSQAIKVKVDYLPAYQPLGYSLARLNRYSEAAEILKEALRYDPNNAEIYNNLGFAYVHAERYADAVEACLQAIRLLGQTGEAFKQGLQNRNEVLSHAYKNLGNAYNGLKQYNEAANALKHATEIEPTNASAHFNLGLALYNGGRYSEAIEAYKAVVKLRPELAGAHYNLGLAYVAVNDKEGARREYNILKPLNAPLAAQLQSAIKN
jgi:tetratricopeptide (TPR) repeat protein